MEDADMEFDSIIQSITSGLTGNSEKDIPYLQKQMVKYKNHEMAKEILRACGRLLYQCLPDDKKTAMGKVIDNDLTSYASVLEEVRFKQHEKKYDEALVLLESLIHKIEAMNLFEDDQVSEYHCFNEFFEEALFRMNTKPAKDIRYADLPLDQIYTQYGSLLIDLKRPKDAAAALGKAMRWNPGNADIAFEHAEAYKLQGDMEAFYRLTIDLFKYAFRPKQVARCFRNLGYYFTEKKQWEESVACYTMSLQYDNESSMAMSELYYIQQKAGRFFNPPGMDYLRKISEKYGFPVGADPDVLGLSFAYGKHFAEKGDAAGARYCWQITYDLTQDEDIRKMIDELPVPDDK